MEIGKCTQRVLQIIQNLEPENATKIFGYLLLRHNLDELMEYAVGNEVQLHSLITEAKSYLISTTKLNSSDNLHPYFRRLSFPPSLPLPAPINLSANQHPFFQKMDHISGNNGDWGVKKLLHSPTPLGFDLPSNFYLPECGFGSKHLLPLSCHYFNKGYCKHGQSCKFFHGQLDRDCINQMPGIGSNDFTLDDNILFSGLLEKLETEIAGLLKERRGLPFSIALLPMLYKEMYGKNLYDEDHLMENYQHGNSSYILTMLLAQMRSIRLIERPHGQHFVVLVEDAPKFMEFISERTDHSTLSSHQIYLTFPAESTFTDADVQNYFNHFGPVHDVRIPRQEKRMFGFVSFYRPQTVKQILTAGHPHVICGSRVLVKPYKEKSRLVERKYAEKLDAQMYLPSLSFDMDNALSANMHSSLGPRAIDTFQFHRNQQIEDCKCTFDQDQRELFEQQPRQRLVNAQPFLGYGLEDSKALEGQFSSLIITSHKKADDVKAGQPGSNCNDFDRLQIQLPDSPFASPRF